MTPGSTGMRDFSWRFAGLFAVYSGGLLLLLQLSPLSFVQTVAEATASAPVLFWRLFDVPFVRDGFFINLLGFPMEVTLECTAAHYITIAAGAVLAYPSHSAGYKAAGLAAIISGTLVLNLVRIGILGLVGHYANSLFPFVHIFIWQGAFALMVVALWAVWVHGRRLMSRLLIRYCLIGFIGAVVSYWVLSVCLPYYARLLSAAAGLFGHPLSLCVDFPSAVSSDGSRIAYLIRGGWAYYRISGDIMNTVVFCVLFITTASPEKWLNVVKRAAAGFILLFVLHLGYVLMYGIICARGIGEDAFGDLTRGFAFLAPVLVWLLVMRLFRAKP